MPVPKQRVGHSDQGHRRSNWKAILPTVASCTNCGAPRHPHTMCGVCGFYKNRIIPKALQGLDFGAVAAATEHVHDENCGHAHEHSHDHGELGHVHDENCAHDHEHDATGAVVDVTPEAVVETPATKDEDTTPTSEA